MSLYPDLTGKANLTCHKCGEKVHLAQESSHTGSSAVAQSQQTPIVNSKKTSCASLTLFPATNPTVSQTITADIPITAEAWHTIIEQLTK